MVSETIRLAELASFAVMDTPAEPAFDELVGAAAEIAGCRDALVGLIDENRQWFKARHGFEDVGTEVPRDETLCQQVVQADAVVVIEDVRTDPRGADLPSLSADAGVGFYAGFPLRTAGGAVVGTLCVVDQDARPQGLSPTQVRLLTVLASQVMTQLELRRSLAERDAALLELRRVGESYRVLADYATDVVSNHALDGTTLYVSPSLQTVLGHDPAAEVGHGAPQRLHPDDAGRMGEALAAVADGRPATVSVRSRHADTTYRDLEIQLSPIRDAGGAVVEVHSVARDVTERVRTERRLSELAVELEATRDEAVRRNALTDTVLDTVSVGIVACDAEGRLTLFNRATREFHGMPPDPDADPADWADRYALYADDGRTRLTHAEIPLVRALTEGGVSDVVMVIAPDGLPARVVRCDGRALHDPAGRLLGAVVVMSDITQARETARVLAEQAEFTRVVLERAHTAIWSCDTTGRPTLVNAAARSVLGLPGLDELVRRHDAGDVAELLASVELMRPDGTPMPPQDSPLERALAGQDTGELEVVLAVRNRPRRVMLLRASPLHDDRGRVTGAILTGQDVTELRASEARFRAAFHDGPTPVARVDRDGAVQEVNPALSRLLGRPEAAFPGRLLGDHVVPEDRARLRAALTGPGTGAEPVEVRMLRETGEAVWCELATTVSADGDGGVFVLAQLLDIAARKSQELVLEEAARRDPLTELGNRGQLDDSVRAVLAKGPGVSAGVLFLDLDGFKEVNDRHGHEAGDAVLVEVAARLLGAVRPEDRVLRLGGDEFVVVCAVAVAEQAPGQVAEPAEEPLAGLAERLERAVATPYAFRGTVLHVGVSVGTAVRTPGQTSAELVEVADQAMYRRKQERRSAAAG